MTARNEEPVRTEGGLLSAVPTADGVVRAFKGVPYARPPLGALRWQPPQPVEAWQSVRRADRFPPRCVQPDRPEKSVSYYGPEAQSEDCLYLNVWTGASSAAERRPVMVWFHGGAYYIGSGALPIFDGEQLARNGVVLITVNYRLGKLGFLAHPDLSKESAQRVSGNYGLMDQIAALRWVRDNIAAFGGDPQRVTIFGQSAGSTSVACHMISPLSKGLFQRAIGQSGGIFGPIAGSTNTGDTTQSLQGAEQKGLEWARAIGAASAAELRAKSAEDLQLARPGQAAGAAGVSDPAKSPMGAFDTAWAIVDGYVLPDSGYDVFGRGAQNDVPLLTGSTAREGATMLSVKSLQAYAELVRAEYGDRADALLKLYPAQSDEEAGEMSQAVLADRTFNWQNWTWVRRQAQTGKSKAFYYRFSKVPPFPPGAAYLEQDPATKLGAFHAAEIPYIYRNLQARKWPWQPGDRELSELISTYWVNFAASGDPNGPGLPLWPAFDAHTEAMMCFDDTTRLAPVPHRERLAFWDAFYTKMRGRA
ncbi:MAG: carboxylesterase family protein [Betaproteobacteria bacterium]|nr:carboxylesterase family protein [Betaproteobacteria bacterium]